MVTVNLSLAVNIMILVVLFFAPSLVASVAYIRKDLHFKHWVALMAAWVISMAVGAAASVTLVPWAYGYGFVLLGVLLVAAAIAHCVVAGNAIAAQAKYAKSAHSPQIARDESEASGATVSDLRSHRW